MTQTNIYYFPLDPRRYLKNVVPYFYNKHSDIQSYHTFLSYIADCKYQNEKCQIVMRFIKIIIKSKNE